MVKFVLDKIRKFVRKEDRTRALHAGANTWPIKDKNSKLKKGHNSEKKMHFELSLLKVWIALWIVYTYSKFQVHIFSNNRDITECFCTTTTMPRLRFSPKTAKLKYCGARRKCWKPGFSSFFSLNVFITGR